MLFLIMRKVSKILKRVHTCFYLNAVFTVFGVGLLCVFLFFLHRKCFFFLCQINMLINCLKVHVSTYVYNLDVMAMARNQHGLKKVQLNIQDSPQFGLVTSIISFSYSSLFIQSSLQSEKIVPLFTVLCSPLLVHFCKSGYVCSSARCQTLSILFLAQLIPLTKLKQFSLFCCYGSLYFS